MRRIRDGGEKDRQVDHGTHNVGINKGREERVAGSQTKRKVA